MGTLADYSSILGVAFAINVSPYFFPHLYKFYSQESQKIPKQLECWEQELQKITTSLKDAPNNDEDFFLQ